MNNNNKWISPSGATRSASSVFSPCDNNVSIVNESRDDIEAAPSAVSAGGSPREHQRQLMHDEQKLHMMWDHQIGATKDAASISQKNIHRYDNPYDGSGISNERRDDIEASAAVGDGSSQRDSLEIKKRNQHNLQRPNKLSSRVAQLRKQKRLPHRSTLFILFAAIVVMPQLLRLRALMSSARSADEDNNNLESQRQLREPTQDVGPPNLATLEREVADEEDKVAAAFLYQEAASIARHGFGPLAQTKDPESTTISDYEDALVRLDN